MTQKILRLPEVLERVGMSKATVYRKIALGQFPKQLMISDGIVGWRESEVDDWILRRPEKKTA